MEIKITAWRKSKRILFLLITASAFFSGDASAQEKHFLQEGISLFERREFHQAKAIFLAALDQKVEKAAQIYFYLGRIFFENKRYSESAEWFEKAVQSAPKTSEYHLWLGRIYGQLSSQSSILKKPLLAFKIKRSFETAVALDPENIEARLAILYFYLKAPALLGGGVSKARAQAGKIEQLAPRFSALANGLIAADGKNFQAAERLLLQAIDVKETASFAYQRLEKIYREKEDLRSAVLMYQGVLERYPEDILALTKLGYLCQETQRYYEAFAAWERIIQLSPNEVNAYLQVGRTSVYSGARLKSGESRILLYLEKTAGDAPNKMAEAHNVLAEIYRLKGESELARRSYLTALEFDPSSKVAKRAIKRLK